MNIHIWSPGFTGAANGITAFSQELALGLVSLGHDVRLFGKADAPGIWHDMPLQGSATRPTRLQSAHFGGAVLIACAVSRPDHIVSTHPNFGAAAHWARRLFGTPYTLVCHGIDVHSDLSRARLQALRAADRVLAVSDWTRQRVLDLGGIEAARVAVLQNTLDDGRYTVAPKPAALAERYNLRPDEAVVLTVGRLAASEGYKGTDRILQALPAIRRACGPVRFLVAGRGDDRPRLEGLARSLGVQEAVTFAGFVPDEELADHYRLADVFAMPSTGEGFGIVYLEAMACGTPVLAGNRDGSVDALDSGRLGRLVDPLDVAAIAGGVIALLQHEGPPWWFDREALHDAVSGAFGRAAFQAKLQRVWPCAA